MLRMGTYGRPLRVGRATPLTGSLASTPEAYENFMIRLAIVDHDGKFMLPKDVTTAADLLTLVEQAKSVIRDCERLAHQKGLKSHAPGSGQAPYLS
jgi:hypothetical protein